MIRRPPLRRNLYAVALLCAATLAAQETSATAPEAAAAPAESSPDVTSAEAGEATPAPPDADAAASAASPEGAPAATAEGTVAEPPEKKPQLVAATLVDDIGRVRKGDRANVRFAIENRGEADLKIKGVQTSCGCTVAKVPSVIAPGEQGEVEAFVDTSNLVGHIVKYLTVTSNDPTTPRLQLTIKGEVVAFLTASPSYARLLHVEGQPPSTTALNLWSDGDPPLEVTGVESPEKWIDASARPAKADELVAGGPPEQWRLEISIHSDAPRGPLDESVTVKTNHPRQRSLSIPVSGFVRPVVQTVPEVADFGRLGKVGDRRRFVLKLFNFGTDPVEVTGVTCDLPFATTTVKPDEAGRRWRIEIDLADDAPKGKFEGTLAIATTSPAAPELAVPVRGRIQ